ncbi:uncharacterized protein LOC116160673 [Photinus pyralis]|uniref:uncharacterized protein LOC116160673 n=1 Tax=Photinus pyralis TaxID=7054 RepID=UPI001266F098|nr:uncharacterized protein LOC116160673 [Photinus pyralis]
MDAIGTLSSLLVRLRSFASLKSSEEIPFDTVRAFSVDLYDFYYFACESLHDYDVIKLLKDCSVEYVNCVDSLLEAGIIDERDDIKLLCDRLEILLVLSSIEGIKDEYARLVVVPLIEKASEPDERLYFSKELLKLVLLMVEKVCGEVKEAIVNDNALQFYKLVDMLSMCADYGHQFTIMKIIFCLFSDEQLQNRAHIMFPGSDTAASDLKNVSLQTFNNDIRHFLNNFNSKSRRIKSFKFDFAFLDSYVITAPNVLDDNIWVDFNLAIKSITILCNKKSLIFNTSIEDDFALEELTVYFDNVEAVDIVKLKKTESGSLGNKIRFKLKTPYAVVHSSSENAANANYLNLILFDSTELNELAKEVLPLIFADHEEDNVCEPKRPDHLTENFSCILTNNERSPVGETFENGLKKSRRSVGSCSTLTMPDGMRLVRRATEVEYEHPKSPSIKLRRRAILQNIANFDSSIGRGKGSASSRQLLEPSKVCKLKNQTFDLEATGDISVNEGIKSHGQFLGSPLEPHDISQVALVKSIDTTVIGEETNSESDKTSIDYVRNENLVTIITNDSQNIIAEQSQLATVGGCNESASCFTIKSDECVSISSDSGSCDIHSRSTIIITQFSDSEYEASTVIIDSPNSRSDTFYSKVTTNDLEPNSSKLIIGIETDKIHDHCSKQTQEVDRQQSSEYLQSNQSPTMRINNNKALDRNKQKEDVVSIKVTPEIPKQIGVERQKSETSLSTPKKTQSFVNIVDDDEENEEGKNANIIQKKEKRKYDEDNKLLYKMSKKQKKQDKDLDTLLSPASKLIKSKETRKYNDENNPRYQKKEQYKTVSPLIAQKIEPSNVDLFEPSESTKKIHKKMIKNLKYLKVEISTECQNILKAYMKKQRRLSSLRKLYNPNSMFTPNCASGIKMTTAAEIKKDNSLSEPSMSGEEDGTNPILLNYVNEKSINILQNIVIKTANTNNVASTSTPLDIERSSVPNARQHKHVKAPPSSLDIDRSMVSNVKQHTKFVSSPLAIESPVLNVEHVNITPSPLDIERSPVPNVKQHAKATPSSLKNGRSPESGVKPRSSPLDIERSPESNQKHVKSTPYSPLDIKRSGVKQHRQHAKTTHSSLNIENGVKQYVKPRYTPLNIERSPGSSEKQHVKPRSSPLDLESSPVPEVKQHMQHVKSTPNPLHIERSLVSSVKQQHKQHAKPTPRPLDFERSPDAKQHAKSKLNPLHIERSLASDVKHRKQHLKHPSRFGDLDNRDEDLNGSEFMTLLKSLHQTIIEGTKAYGPNKNRSSTYTKGKRSANKRKYPKLRAQGTCFDKSSSDDDSSEVILKRYSDACNKVGKFLYSHQKKGSTPHFERVSRVILQEHSKIYDRMLDVDQAYRTNYNLKESLVNTEFKRYLHKYVK